MIISVNNEIELVLAFLNCEDFDTIVLKCDVYYLSDTLYLKTNNVTITSDSNVRSVMDFSKSPYGTNGFVIECDNVTIKNVIVRNAGNKGVLAQTKNSVFENIDTSYNCDCGFQLKHSSNTKVIDCCSHDNFGYMTMKNGKPNFGFNSDGFCDKQYEGPGNTWINCKAWNNSDDGFDFYERITPEGSPTVIENCSSFNNGYSEKDISKNPRVKTDYSFLGVCGYDLTKFPSYGNGNGFKLGGGNKEHSVIMNNCFAFNNKRNGFTQNNNKGKVELTKCFAVNNNEYNFGFNSEGGELSVVNCITLKGLSSIETKNYKYKIC